MALGTTVHPQRGPARNFPMALVGGTRATGLLLLVALTCACGSASAALLSIQGDARDPANGRLLYREQHLIRQLDGVPGERVVVYRCPDGIAFARKHVDYRVSRTAPDFEMRDVRSNYREGLRHQSGATQVWSGDAAPKTVRVGTDGLVADTGFDEYVRARWDVLVSGAPQTVAFAVPALGRSLPFQVRSLGLRQLDGSPAQWFHLKLGGLLGLIGPSMDVAYSANGKRLRRFIGVTNLRDDRGKPLQARIDFPPTSATVDASQWQAALALPLAKCSLGR